LFARSTNAGTITVGVLDEEIDIVNTGLTLIEASNFGGTGVATVNGITHANSNSTYGPVNFSGAFGDPNPGVFTGDFFTLIDGIAGTDEANEPGTLSVAGLTIGQAYLFQSYWLVKNNFGTRTLDVTFEGSDSQTGIAANPNTSEAVLISYQWTALDDTLNVSFASGDPNNVWSQGFSLQEVPEPSTFALATLGLLGLLACGRRRRR